ncbi:GH18655 [Drosophila grimshawi]|uniref:GH18655 n=2 Tax=Drosophila grimshawi TaxID=7222 RepID=B4JH63_DROGR|nr:GH18655 [Drosophila grimshawi]
MWDKTHKDFSIRSLKHSFWMNLKYTLEKRFNCRAYTNELARKWLNLLSYYRAQQKAILDANGRGAQPEEIKRLEGWKFFQLMKFLPLGGHDKNGVDVENVYDSTHSEDSDNISSSAPIDETQASSQYADPGSPFQQSTSKVASKNKAGKQIAIEEFNVPMEDNDIEIEETTSIPLEPMTDGFSSTPSFHYGMAIGQEVFELEENLKIDAKMEIMQVIVKYQKQQLHRTAMNLAGS